MIDFSKKSLLKKCSDVIKIENGSLKILNENKLRLELIPYLVSVSALSEDSDSIPLAQWIVRLSAIGLGAVPASIQGLYEAMGKSQVPCFTVPAFNIRTLTFDTARSIFKVAKKLSCGPFIFEIARSEMNYTKQTPSEYATSILGAALTENWKGPVFIQGDHVQVSRSKYLKNAQEEMGEIKNLIKSEINAGFYNIDIDASTMVDLDAEDYYKQQEKNFTITAELVQFIRKIQPNGVVISIGAEIGEVGGKNSTPEEFEAFMSGLQKELDIKRVSPKISKISVQTGTSHGGIPLPDGKIAEVKLDFKVLETIGKIAREKYGLSGAVQHGASTLPEELFDKFPVNFTSEIHLATGFQNIFYEHPSLPQELKKEMTDYIMKNYEKEKKANETTNQFLYKMRKHALGPFKKDIWGLPENIKKDIISKIENKVELIMEKLSLKNTKGIVDKYVSCSAPYPPVDYFLEKAFDSNNEVEGE